MEFTVDYLCLELEKANLIKCEAFSIFIEHKVGGHTDVKNDHRHNQEHTMAVCDMVWLKLFSTDVQCIFQSLDYSEDESVPIHLILYNRCAVGACASSKTRMLDDTDPAFQAIKNLLDNAEDEDWDYNTYAENVGRLSEDVMSMNRGKINETFDGTQYHWQASLFKEL